MSKSVFPSWVWLIYGFLFLLSIPWYLPASLEMNLYFGLPLWVVTCIGAILLIAIFTLFIIRKYWTEDE